MARLKSDINSVEERADVNRSFGITFAYTQLALRMIADVIAAMRYGNQLPQLGL